jgi:hypothetical protein
MARVAVSDYCIYMPHPCGAEFVLPVPGVREMLGVRAPGSDPREKPAHVYLTRGYTSGEMVALPSDNQYPDVLFVMDCLEAKADELLVIDRARTHLRMGEQYDLVDVRESGVPGGGVGLATILGDCDHIVIQTADGRYVGVLGNLGGELVREVLPAPRRLQTGYELLRVAWKAGFERRKWLPQEQASYRLRHGGTVLSWRPTAGSQNGGPKPDPFRVGAVELITER